MDANISTRQKDGGYQVIVSFKDDNGRWRQRTRQGFATKKEAKRAGLAILEELKAAPAARSNDFAGITFGEFAALFMRDMEDTLRPGTLHNYRVAFRASPGLLDLPLAKIKHADVLAAVRSWDVKPLTAVNRLSLLSRVFNHAIKPYRLLVVNPTADIKVRVEKQRKVKALTADALEAFLATVEAEASPAFVIICQLAGLAGLRLSEALGLTWSDVDFPAATITVSGQLGRNGKQRTPPKSANGYRTIPAPPRLLAALAAYRRETIPHINGLVVGNAIARNTVLVCMRRYANRAFTLHALRHTYATTLLANGVDVRTVAALIGDDVKTVLSTYIHYTDDMRAQAAADIKKIFG